MKRRHIVNLVTLLAFQIVIVLLLYIFDGSVYIFDGLVGPAESSVVQRTDDNSLEVCTRFLKPSGNPFNRHEGGVARACTWPEIHGSAFSYHNRL